MTTILVATDFSDSSHWATDYAVQLASQLRTRLVVMNAYDVVPDIDSVYERLSSTAESQYRRTLSKLSTLREALRASSHGSVEVNVVARPGAPEARLIAEAASQKADLLVMGLVGDDPQLARQLGSLATGMISQTHVPMLLVPPGALFKKPQNMLLAVDLAHPIDALAIGTVLRFARLLDTTIDVVCVEDEPDAAEKQAAQHLRDLLRHQPHTFSFISGYDVAGTLNSFLADYKADLLVLLPKHHSKLRTYLLESVTQEVSRLANVPVLAAV